MPWVSFDENGDVSGTTKWPHDGQTFLADDDPLLVAWRALRAQLEAPPPRNPVPNANGNSVPELRDEFNGLLAELRSNGTIPE